MSDDEQNDAPHKLTPQQLADMATHYYHGDWPTFGEPLYKHIDALNTEVESLRARTEDLEGELERYKTAEATLWERAKKQDATIESLRARLEAALALLREHQWSGGHHATCLECGEFRAVPGHADDCALADALRGTDS